MKRALYALALVASPALADTRKDAEHWELAFQALNVVDAVQTIDCLNRDACHEINPLIGRDPSTEKVVAVKVGAGAIHYLLFRLIADRDPKAAKLFSQVSVVVQGGVVAANLRFAF